MSWERSDSRSEDPQRIRSGVTQEARLTVSREQGDSGSRGPQRVGTRRLEKEGSQ